MLRCFQARKANINIQELRILAKADKCCRSNAMVLHQTRDVQMSSSFSISRKACCRKSFAGNTHEGNVATAVASQAVGFMKSKMTETVATSSAAQGSVAATLAPAVLVALPKRATLSRALRHHRQQHLHHNADGGYPPAPTDLTFPVPLSSHRSCCTIRDRENSAF